MNLKTAALLTLLVVSALHHSRADVLTVSPITDGDVSRIDLASPYTTVDTTTNEVQMLRSLDEPYGDLTVGIFEFDLTSLPKSATIDSAYFAFNLKGIQGPETQYADFHAYAADGVVTTSDATAIATFASQWSGNSTQLLVRQFAILDPSILEFVRDASPFLGLRTEFATPRPSPGGNVSFDLGFVSSEGSTSRRPFLVINYTIPEPPSIVLGLLAVGTITLAIVLRSRPHVLRSRWH